MSNDITDRMDGALRSDAEVIEHRWQEDRRLASGPSSDDDPRPAHPILRRVVFWAVWIALAAGGYVLLRVLRVDVPVIVWGLVMLVAGALLEERVFGASRLVPWLVK